MQRLGCSSRLQRLQRLQNLPPPWTQQTRSIRVLERRTVYPRRHPSEWTVPLRATYPLYQISDALLDLDAQDATGVRPFDSEVDGEPLDPIDAHARRQEPLDARARAFDDQYQKYDAAFRRNADNKFHSAPISDLDLLTLTLEDIPSSDAASRSPAISSVLDQNGVPESVRHDAPATIGYLLHRRKFTRPPPWEHTDLPRLRETLGNCDTIALLERTVFEVMRTTDGRRLLSDLTGELASLCRLEASKRERCSGRHLAFLNDVVIGLTAAKLPISVVLFETGFRLSLTLGYVAMAQTYLFRMIQAGKAFDQQGIIDILHLASRETNRALKEGLSEGVEALSLFAGHLSGDPQRRHSIGSLISQISLHPSNKTASHDIYASYFSYLAKLGALRTLWHEWHETNRRIPASARSHMQLDSSSDDAPVTRALGYSLFTVLEHYAGSLAQIAQTPNFTIASAVTAENFHLDAVVTATAAPIMTKGTTESSHILPFREKCRVAQLIFGQSDPEKMLLALQVFIRQYTSRQ